MSVTTHIFWLLCAFASVALSAAPARTPLLSSALILSGVFVGWWWQASYPVALQSLGLLVAIAAAGGLSSNRGAMPAAVVAGIAGALWAAALTSSGLPRIIATPVAVAPALLSAYFSAARARFAPPLVRDEALLLVLAVALIASVTPRILEGWRSAQLLNAAAGTASPLPGWILGVMAALMGTGGAYALWKRA